MADYKTIHGVNLRDYTTDPDTLIEGQVWYDKTNKVVQFFHNNVTTAGSWLPYFDKVDNFSIEVSKSPSKRVSLGPLYPCFRS